MSHIVEAKTSIVKPDRALLREAVKLVARQYEGGQVASHYFNFSGQKIDTPLSIFSHTVRRGMAVVVKEETGELVFVGDFWGYAKAYEEMQKKIQQTYVAMATMKVLQKMGYATKAEDEEKEGVIRLTGVNQYA